MRPRAGVESAREDEGRVGLARVVACCAPAAVPGWVLLVVLVRVAVAVEERGRVGFVGVLSGRGVVRRGRRRGVGGLVRRVGVAEVLLGLVLSLVDWLGPLGLVWVVGRGRERVTRRGRRGLCRVGGVGVGLVGRRVG